MGAGVAGGVVAAGAIGYFVRDPLMNAAGQTNSSSSSSTVLSTSTSSSTSSSPSSSSSSGSTTTTTTSTGAASSINQQNVFLILNTTEVAELAAIISAIIPTDSTGPGGKEAGVIYFIDRQLATDYGKNGNMYNKGPFVMPGQRGPITVNSLNGTPITYSGGSMITAPTAGTQYFYGMLLSDFWRYGLDAFETYCNSAYGGNFENLSSIHQVQALTDLVDNKPTSFNGIIPSDFFNEVFFMAWCGFLMDPLYGGNQGMVGWELVGFNGVNMGNFYGEGHTDQELMVASTPTRLKPASLAQFQQAGGLGSTSSSSSTTTSSSSS